MCGVGANSVAYLMKYHLLQWDVVKVKCLMNSNTTLTGLNLHQKTDPKVQQEFKGQGHYNKVKGQIKVPCGTLNSYSMNIQLVLYIDYWGHS